MGFLANILGISDDELTKLRGLVRTFQQFEDDQRTKWRKLDNLEDTVNRRLNQDASGVYSDVLREALNRIDKTQLVEEVTEKIRELLEKEVQRAAKEIVKDSDLADQILDAIDEDALEDSVVEAFTGSDKFEVWLKANIDTLATAIVEDIADNDRIDWDSLNEAIANAVVDRLDWKPTT